MLGFIFFSLHALSERSCSSASLPTYYLAWGPGVYTGDQEEGSAAVQGNSDHDCILQLSAWSSILGCVFLFVFFSTPLFPHRGLFESFFSNGHAGHMSYIIFFLLVHPSVFV